MHSNQNAKHQNSISDEDVFRQQMQRMFSTWTVSDREIRIGKAVEFRTTFDRIGAKKFKSATDNAIQHHATGFFPTPGEFEAYIPALPKPQGVNIRTMAEILEKQKEWDEPETVAILQRMDRMIKGGLKDMNAEFRRDDRRRDADRVEHERKIAEARRQA